eukprot:2955725-Amphidinium_carterae.3
MANSCHSTTQKQHIGRTCALKARNIPQRKQSTIISVCKELTFKISTEVLYFLQAAQPDVENVCVHPGSIGAVCHDLRNFVGAMARPHSAQRTRKDHTYRTCPDQGGKSCGRGKAAKKHLRAQNFTSEVHDAVIRESFATLRQHHQNGQLKSNNRMHISRPPRNRQTLLSSGVWTSSSAYAIWEKSSPRQQCITPNNVMSIAMVETLVCRIVGCCCETTEKILELSQSAM